MARSQTLGQNIPMIRRIQRYSTMATLFRSFSDSGQSLVEPRTDPNDSNIVKSTLLPSGSTLPVGTIVPTAGYTPTVERVVQAPPPIQRAVSAPPAAPVQESDPSPTPPAVQKEPASPADHVASLPQAESDSLISDSDWNRLRTVMRGHQEKLAREKETPEYIQRQKDKSEQEATKKEADAETRRRQDLARAGKLPRAGVVYLSPEEHTASTIPHADESKAATQAPVDQIAEGPEAIELPEVATDAGELTSGGDVSQAPAPIQKSDERARPKLDSAKRPVQLTPRADAPPAPSPAAKPMTSIGDQLKTEEHVWADGPIKSEQDAAPAKQIQLEPEAPDDHTVDQVEEGPEDEYYKPQEQLEIERTPATALETSGSEQESKESVEKDPFDESTPEFDTAKTKDTPAAKTIQLKPEIAAKPPSQEPQSVGKTVGEPKTEEKTSFGQRLLGAAKSLFRRQDEPAPTAETTVSLAVDDKISREEVDEEIIDQPSVEIPIETKDAQISERTVEYGGPESKRADASIPTPTEQPAQPVAQRSKDQPETEIAEGSVTSELTRPAQVEADYSNDLEEEPPLVSESEAASEEISRTGQPVDLPEEAIHPVAEDRVAESPVEKAEPAAKIEPKAPAPTISRIPDSVQAEEYEGKPADIQQKPAATGPMPLTPQKKSETAKTIQDDSSREPDMGFPAPVTTASTDVADVDLRETVKSGGFGPEPDQAGDDFEDESSSQIQPPTAVDSDEGESAIQEQPLQEVWPAREATPSPPSVIARKPSEETEDPSSPIDEGDLPTLVFQVPVEEDVGNEDELRSTLKGVSPGKPTDSSIELLPPRRPRPQIAPVQRSEDVIPAETSSTQAPTQEEKQITPEQSRTPEYPKTAALESSVESLQRYEEERQSQPPVEVSDQPVQRHTEEPLSQKPTEIPGQPVRRHEDELVSRKPADVLDQPIQRHEEEPVSRKPSEILDQSVQQHEEEPVSRKPSDVLDRPEVISPPDVRPEQPPSRSPVPGFAQTEIGELPSDLWDYLGETPPEPPPSTTPEPAAPATTAPLPGPRSESIPPAITAPVPTPLQTFADSPTTDLALDTVQRTEAKSETSTPVLDFETPLQPFGLESALDWIQRQDETVRPAEMPDNATDQVEEAGQSEADIEDLARKILPIIKRKLSIEWERSRGRF